MANHIKVHVGDQVEISLVSNPGKTSNGIVFKVLTTKDSYPKTVILRNGDKGVVHRIINSTDIIKERIMNEGQHTENKENFGEKVMQSEVIPQTIQSFLNSDGGHLYIGVKDSGEINERLIGLEYDFRWIDGYENMDNDKLCDKLGMRIMAALNKYLTSTENIGDLVRIQFIEIEETQIAEIAVDRSPQPWFFQPLSRNKKPKKFDLFYDGQKIQELALDYFYIRVGGAKSLIETHKEFYEYARDHFIKI